MVKRTHAAVAVASDAELAFLLKTAGGEAPLERATALFARCDLDRDLLLSGKELEAALAAAQDDVRANEAATVRGKAADPAARERYLAQRLATDALVRGLAVVASVGVGERASKALALAWHKAPSAEAQQLLWRSPQMSKDKFIQGMAHCYGMTYDEKKKALGGRPSRGAMGHRDALRLIGELWEQRAA